MEKEEQKIKLNNSVKHIKKQYILKKNNDISDLNKVKDSFLDPNQYLKNQKEMTIGNFPSKYLSNNTRTVSKIFLSNSKDVSPPKKALQRQEKNKIKKKEKLIRNNSCINNSKTNNKNYDISNDKDNPQTHYEIKSLGEMLKIFNKYKTIEKESKSNRKRFLFENKNISSEVCEEIGKNLSGQEKALYHQEEVKNYSNSFCKLISRKIKRNENDLLYNKIGEYRIKKQLMDLKEMSKSVRDKFGDNYWVASLRRPETSKEIRFFYSNTNNSSNKSPDLIIDHADKDIEFISYPNIYNNSRYSEIIKDINSFRKIHKLKFGFPNMEKIAEMKMIQGKNLLELEFNDFKEKKNNKFKLYKDPLEIEQKNMKELLCKESFDVKYKIQRNHSCTNVESIIKNINTNKKKGLYRSKSQLVNYQDKKNNKKIKEKKSYLQKALKKYFKEKKERQSDIKIIYNK